MYVYIMHVCMYVYVCLCVCVYVCMYACMYVYVCMCVCMCMCVYVCVCMYVCIIIFINCNWVVTRWQWLFYMYTNMGGRVTRKFKYGGLHERHLIATWKLGNHLSIRL